MRCATGPKAHHLRAEAPKYPRAPADDGGRTGGQTASRQTYLHLRQTRSAWVMLLSCCWLRLTCAEAKCSARPVTFSCETEALGARLRLREVDSEFALYALEALELRGRSETFDGLHGAACALAHEVEP